MTNQITAQRTKSIYPMYDEEYLDFYIDGTLLSDLLDTAFPSHQLKGLVPTTGGWLMDREDETPVWARILPDERQTTLCPILICPDDQDYFCTTVLVEIERTGEEVRWNRFGLNREFEFRKYELLGKSVDWFANSPSCVFAQVEYQNVIELMRADRT
ncbi:MAG: hypothetical protein KA765_07670 [Thermoflexales bacterium]|nr:hypothetical protein [Thermoflexales bacterium]